MNKVKAERRALTQPAEWWAAFEKQAEKRGLSLSAWMAECCLKFVPEKTRRKLPERPPAHRPKSE